MKYAKIYNEKIRQVIEAQEGQTENLQALPNNSLYLVVPIDENVGVGYSYERGKFIPPQPYNSWILNENMTWEAPFPMPADSGYMWDENSVSWIKIEEAL